MMTPAPSSQLPGVYERLGGAAGVRALVDRFYALMDAWPELSRLRRIHPPSLAGSADRLFNFLNLWWGGDPTGHGRSGPKAGQLCEQHAPYAIGPAESDEWLLCMQHALEAQAVDAELRAALMRAFTAIARQMGRGEG